MAAGQPLFVTSLEPETNTVVVGGADDLLRSACQLEDVNWIAADEFPSEPVRATARVRYRSREVPCTARRVPTVEVVVEFDEPQRAITPGQALVLYDGEYVLGGGTISR